MLPNVFMTNSTQSCIRNKRLLFSVLDVVTIKLFPITRKYPYLFVLKKMYCAADRCNAIVSDIFAIRFIINLGEAIGRGALY